ncbi:reverse transcriptase domain-containing protein [Psychroserpens sp. NJDZ02]|uniref:reverse transcriptase domain-containing protein n=1 Tax=Psychroserpens sp. NJDZ02 TaxID=2570561 RepID=UPI0010A7BE95|nr:reverse transcriptase domain-containing protein [Psychroserpens sp. NJDZ02]QCE42394.1 RNA-directed DNA polymerase [Psychroserpens sp. NJDZ02]
MKLEKQHTEQIIKQFKALRTKDDLVVLINKVNLILYGDKFISLTVKGLNYYANPEYSDKRYSSFSIKKKSGGERIINAPVNGLKHILRPLNIILNSIAMPHAKATGFVLGKSIVDNAQAHVGYNYVYNIDLKDFFHSFDRNRVKLGFICAPFNLNGLLEPIAFLLASLCTHPFEIDGVINTVLPQGAPTSPTITNILCVKLDRRLNGLAKRFKANYTRYADDITFSCNVNIFKNDEFLKELNRIIAEDQNLILNDKKTRLQQTGNRQAVTGLTVNTKVNVNSKYIKQLRMWLYYWEKYGFNKAESIFLRDYAVEKGQLKKGKPNFKSVLGGKLEYLKMVKGFNDSTYLKLNTRFTKLSKTESKLEQTLKAWENNGIEKAMEIYKLAKIN